MHTECTLRAVNHSEIGVLGKATISVSTPYCQTTMTGLVTDNVAEVVLGIDWLTANEVSWDFVEGGVNILGRKHRLFAKPESHK